VRKTRSHCGGDANECRRKNEKRNTEEVN